MSAQPDDVPVAWMYEWLAGSTPDDMEVMEREFRTERDLDDEDGARVTPLYAASRIERDAATIAERDATIAARLSSFLHVDDTRLRDFVDGFDLVGELDHGRDLTDDEKYVALEVLRTFIAEWRNL